MGFWECISWGTNFIESGTFGLIVSHGLFGRCFVDLLSLLSFLLGFCLMAFSFCLCILKRLTVYFWDASPFHSKKNSSMPFIEPCLLNSVPGSRCMPFCYLMRLIRLPFFVLRSCCSVLWLFYSSCRSCESCLSAVLFVVRPVQAPVKHLHAVLFDEGCLSVTHRCPTYPQAYLKENVWGVLLK